MAIHAVNNAVTVKIMRIVIRNLANVRMAVNQDTRDTFVKKVCIPYALR